jgi:hypothetical protein
MEQKLGKGFEISQKLNWSTQLVGWMAIPALLIEPLCDAEKCVVQEMTAQDRSREDATLTQDRRLN